MLKRATVSLNEGVAILRRQGWASLERGGREGGREREGERERGREGTVEKENDEALLSGQVRCARYQLSQLLNTRGTTVRTAPHALGISIAIINTAKRTQTEKGMEVEHKKTKPHTQPRLRRPPPHSGSNGVFKAPHKVLASVQSMYLPVGHERWACVAAAVFSPS